MRLRGASGQVSGKSGEFHYGRTRQRSEVERSVLEPMFCGVVEHLVEPLPRFADVCGVEVEYDRGLDPSCFRAPAFEPPTGRAALAASSRVSSAAR